MIRKKQLLRKFYEKEGKNRNLQLEYFSPCSIINYIHRIRKHWIEKLIRTSLSENFYFLDVGCSEGLLTALASNYCSFAVGLDIAVSKIKKAKALSNGTNTDFIVADAENLPLRDKVFHVILCAELLEHVMRPLKVLNEMQRLCKRALIVAIPGAITCITRVFLNILGKGNELALLDPFLTGSGHLHIIRFQALRKELERRNFELKQLINSGAIGAFPWGQLGYWNWKIIQKLPKRLSTSTASIFEKFDRFFDNNSYSTSFAAHYIIYATKKRRKEKRV